MLVCTLCLRPESKPKKLEASSILLGFSNILLPTATIVSADNTISELFFFTALFFSSATLKT